MTTRKRVMSYSLTLMLIFVFQISYVSAYSEERPKVLVVCSDLGDVMFANSLSTNGTLNVDVLYLGKDLPDDRSHLSDVLYLVNYDEIWIPDFNSELTYGGRLTRDEINALRTYVKNGGILVLGMNTYTQSWSKPFEEITGNRIIRVEKPAEDSNRWDIVYNNRVYKYNDIHQVVVVNPYRAEVFAKYVNGLPAVTVSKFGRGVGVLITFNPVKEVLELNPEIMALYLDVSSRALSERSSPPSLSEREIFIIKVKRVLLHPLFLGLLAFLVAEVLAYFGVLPFNVTVLLAFPLLPLSEFLLKWYPYREITKTIRFLRGITLSELGQELRMKKRRLKFLLALLILRGHINIIDLTPLGMNDVLVILKGLEAEGVASWAVRRYPRLMEIIANNPGVGVIELAHRVNMPPYDVLKLLRELSRYEVVELRKIVVDYEVYPMRPLLRWFEV